MSNKELAIQLLDRIPETKMYYILGVLEGAAIPDELPNAETIDAIQDLENGDRITVLGKVLGKAEED
ncbi:hypothetical protein D3Z51_09030 [Clostridiaceae bacterium]|nr:hypothetical protein [Clostridiaceae bacterium]RKI14400.1 hypothetical protein D7V81_08515 [bacterium 1XD21-70]